MLTNCGSPEMLPGPLTVAGARQELMKIAPAEFVNQFVPTVVLVKLW